MEKKENWINAALQREVEWSKTEISDALVSQLKNIGKATTMLSWRQVSWMAASIALLISFNFTIVKSSTTSNSSKTEQIYNSYFSHINSTIE